VNLHRDFGVNNRRVEIKASCRDAESIPKVQNVGLFSGSKSLGGPTGSIASVVIIGPRVLIDYPSISSSKLELEQRCLAWSKEFWNLRAHSRQAM
jgi:transposase-like protein